MWEPALALLRDNLPPLPVPRLSYSSLKDMKACPYRWKLKRLDGVEEPRSVHMVIGSATHAGNEHWYKTGDSDAATTAAFDYLDKHWDDAFPKTIAETKNVVGRMVEAYATKYPQAEALLIEHQRTLDLSPTLDLTAIADLITVDQMVVDVKTRGKMFTPDPLQLALTAVLFNNCGVPVTHGQIRALRKDVTGARVQIAEEYDFVFTEQFIQEQMQEVIRRCHEIAVRIPSDLWIGPKEARTCLYQCGLSDGCTMRQV